MSLRTGVDTTSTQEGQDALKAKQDYLAKMYGEKKKVKKKVKKVAKSNVTITDCNLLPEAKKEDSDSEGPTVVDIEGVMQKAEAPKASEPVGQWASVGAASTGRHDSDSDAPPRRATRHDSDSDEAPPRPRRARHDSDSDASPPRHAAKPPARQRHDSDSDAPPRRPDRHDSDSDAPPTKSRKRSRSRDASPPRRRDADLSPPRRRDSTDLSPPRRRDGSGDLSPPRAAQRRSQSPGYMGDGTRAGLRTAAEQEEENRRMQEEEERRWAQLRPEDIGYGAKTRHRHKSGKEMSEMEIKERIEHLQKSGKKEEPKLTEQEMIWGSGVVQKKLREESEREQAELAAAPFARGKDDEKYNQWKREELHPDDPMAKFLGLDEDTGVDLSQKEKLDKKARKKLEKELAKKIARKKKVYKGRWAPNRFGIPPGHRWDGVDRSNGYEKRLFEAKIAAESKKRDEKMSAWTGMD